MKAKIERSEAVRLNATVPDAPTWEQVQKAWYAVGADVAGLDWSAFVRKVSAATAAPQPAQQPLTEKDTLLRRALGALEGFANITSDSQGVAGYHLNGDTAEWDEFDEVDAASNTIEAIRNHFGVKND